MTAVREVAIITGGASGIGRALAQLLAPRGTELVLLDVNETELAKTVAAIEVAGGRVRGHRLDVRDADRFKELVDATANELGRIDLFFNNAGIAIVGDALEFSVDDWNRLIDVNLRGAIYGTIAAYPIMKRQGFGHIVNIASVAGLVPTPGFAAYAATKHGVVGFTHAMRGEAARHNVRMTAVCPGFIRTAMVEGSELRGVEREAALKEIESLINTADSCAREIVFGLDRNPATLVVTGHARMMWRAYRWFPGLFHWFAAKQAKKLALGSAATQ